MDVNHSYLQDLPLFLLLSFLPGTMIAACLLPGTVIAACLLPGTVIAACLLPGTVIAACLPRTGISVCLLPGTVIAACLLPGTVIADYLLRYFCRKNRDIRLRKLACGSLLSEQDLVGGEMVKCGPNITESCWGGNMANNTMGDKLWPTRSRSLGVSLGTLYMNVPRKYNVSIL